MANMNAEAVEFEIDRLQKCCAQYRVEIEQKNLRIANLELANGEARKTIDRLNAMIPRNASDAAHSGQPHD